MLVDWYLAFFAASKGGGGAELAQYDDDGNGWIDENDCGNLGKTA